jgi:hypothetical protein
MRKTPGVVVTDGARPVTRAGTVTNYVSPPLT